MLIFSVLAALLPLVSPEIIVQLFEWSHQDVAKECVRFLAPYGYSAVQVSPVNEHAILSGRPWYERYQPVSYALTSRSGNNTAFKNMVETCNGVGVRVYVDVVFNHMTANLPPGTKGTGGSVPDTTRKQYPAVPYGPGDFHPSCTIDDWNNRWQIRNCELVGLHDLNQTTEYVRGKIVEFLNVLVDIGVSGFRVDAAKHMDPSDLDIIYKRVHNLNTRWFPKGSRPYFYQEVAGYPDDDVIKPHEYTSIGGAMDFKYGFELARALNRENKLKWFRTFGEMWGLLPWKDSVVFLDNHDTQRDGMNGKPVLTYKQSKEYKMATGFMLAWPHTRARVMSSYSFNKREQGPPPYPVPLNQDLSCSGGWVCEHRWRQVYSMVTFANVVEGTDVNHWWDNDNYQIAFSRGNKGFIAINAEQKDLGVEVQTSLEPGVYCDVISGLKQGSGCTGSQVTVMKNGKARIKIPANAFDGFIAIHSKVSAWSDRGGPGWDGERRQD
ncbi:alpha-amylase 1 [Halyomorpha halys]|uniref:alpha-amylase 1 n=1 Tax=Halyomorpha halys TaxID=286706 RepID=UPI0006D51F53